MSNKDQKDNKRKKPDKEDNTASDEAQPGLFSKFTEATSSAFKFAKKTSGTSYKLGKAIIQSQDQLKLMVAAGQSLKDLREVAGLTVSDLNDALNLKDNSILDAVENGTATLSFELILRLSALLARNDPVPFILKYSRAYSPETWKILNDWGAGKLPLHFERERQFINIYRSKDEARELSDEGYTKVLEFTKQAFNLSLHFITEQENAVNDLKNSAHKPANQDTTVNPTNETKTSTNNTHTDIENGGNNESSPHTPTPQK